MRAAASVAILIIDFNLSLLRFDSEKVDTRWLWSKEGKFGLMIDVKSRSDLKGSSSMTESEAPQIGEG